MALPATARFLCGPVYRQQPVCCTSQVADVPVRYRRLARQSDFLGRITLRTTNSKLLRWNVSKPGRGGRLFVEAAHSAVPEAAGLFNPANDKVSLALHVASLAPGLGVHADTEPAWLRMHTLASHAWMLHA